MNGVYTGETARNLNERSKEHYYDLKRNNQNSWMRKHIDSDHGGEFEGVTFSWRVLKKHPKPLDRQLHEAVRIGNKTEKENLNPKNEFNGQRVRRVGLDNNHMDYVCNFCAARYQIRIEVNEHVKNFHQQIKCVKCDYVVFGTSGKNEH